MSEKVNRASLNPNNERMRQLKELFPEAFTEGKLDLGKFRDVVGDEVENRLERYNFTWAGKQDAIKIIQTPSRATLVPVREESVNFDITQNVFIEGDNLEVLKLLMRSYYGRVKMIYIDPPYNTGNDFVYPDDYADPLNAYLKMTGQVDANGDHTTSNTDRNGRYHSAWLSMMYPRLFLARQLLRMDGAIFISIGEEEYHSLRMLLNEIFGEENYRNTILVRRYDKNLNRQFMDSGLKTLNVGAEYVLIYARSEEFNFNPVFRPASEERQTTGYWKGFWNAPNRPTMRYSLLSVMPQKGQWKWGQEKAFEAVQNYKEYMDIHSSAMTLEDYWNKTGRTKKFIRRNITGSAQNQGVEHWIPPSSGILRSSNWVDVLASQTLEGVEFDSPKNVSFIKELIKLCCDEGDLVLDFFAGSGTTGQAIIELNAELFLQLNFILVQLPVLVSDGLQVISDIARERLKKSLLSISGTLFTLQLEGFRTFHLAISNFNTWPQATPENDNQYLEQLSYSLDPMLDAENVEWVLFELLLEYGLGLSCPIELLHLPSGAKVFRLKDSERDQSVYVCFESRVTQKILTELSPSKEDIFVCKDSALSDNDGINVALHYNLKTM